MKNQLLNIAYTMLTPEDLTDEGLNSIMDILEGLRKKRFSAVTDIEMTWIRHKLEAELGVTVSHGEDLHGGDHKPWLDDIKGDLPWHYWSAYREYLKRTGFNPVALGVLDEDTHSILDLCGNPEQEGSWGIQGLVMGDVQSGKTANYSGLINKAADTGYKMIVLLTGMIEDLRAQSQERLDIGFVGQDSRWMLGSENHSKKGVGVGEFKRDAPHPNVLTSVDSDFLTKNKQALRGIPLENISAPVLLVMKKNVSPLRNLVSFLESQLERGATQLNLPLLLIDDEADNASVNAKKDEDPAAINKLIRQVLSMFSRYSYVAYTATPFANVFINPDTDDLFPENFVYALNAPTNYISAASVFSEAGSHAYQVQDIADGEKFFPWSHKKHHQVNKIPPSLMAAIETFLLSCAIRDLRKESLRHRSMLVNVTRFTDVQDRLSHVVKAELSALQDDIRQYLAGDEVWSNQPRLQRLHQTWQDQYQDCEFSWDQIRKSLNSSVASIKVVTVNQKTAETDRLNYSSYKDTEKGRRVIAIGGLTLSRGLTLEGLSVSYFLRNSKAYDTLLQMGRWFGYRKGYEDLCRIWMDPEVQDWFGHVANVIGELRQDIHRMHANEQPPKHFGIRVQSHPGSLIVTALNKMRNAMDVPVSISFSNCGIETPYLPNDKEINTRNIETTSNFLAKISSYMVREERKSGSIKESFFWSRVPASLIEKYLRSLEISNMNLPFISNEGGVEKPLIDFIGQNEFPILGEWDIALPQGEGSEPVQDFLLDMPDGTSVRIHPRQRQFEDISKTSPYLKLNKLRVGDTTDEMKGIGESLLAQAREDWQAKEQGHEKKRAIPGSFYRSYRPRPLLTISLIQPKDAPPPEEGTPEKTGHKKTPRKMMKVCDINSAILVGVGLSFPNYDSTLEKQKVKYRMNKVAIRNMGLIEEDDDDTTEYDND
ncbi:Z1 domain-containing protein [Brachymonas denitrificans]|nr:Z1 domain-containing protein [Brachymonas denitrificans]